MSYYGEQKIKDAIKKLKNGDATNQEIADILGVTEFAVRQYLKGVEPGFSKGLRLIEHIEHTEKVKK